MAYSKTSNNPTKKYVQLAAVGLGLVLAYKLYGVFIKGIGDIGNSIDTAVVSNTTGISNAVVSKCQRIADTVREDMQIKILTGQLETRMNDAVAALGELSDSLEVRLCSQLYVNKYSKSMKSEVSTHHTWLWDDSIPDLVSENWF